jgi:hypothetical protein
MTGLIGKMPVSAGVCLGGVARIRRLMIPGVIAWGVTDRKGL